MARTAPRHNLTDDPYYSDGMRLVVVLAEHSVVPGQIGVYDWEEPEGPIAAGQSDDAARPVPIDAPSAPPAPRAGTRAGDVREAAAAESPP